MTKHRVTGVERHAIRYPDPPPPGTPTGILLRDADRDEIKARLDAGEQLAVVGATPEEHRYDERLAVARALNATLAVFPRGQQPEVW